MMNPFNMIHVQMESLTRHVDHGPFCLWHKLIRLVAILEDNGRVLSGHGFCLGCISSRSGLRSWTVFIWQASIKMYHLFVKLKPKTYSISSSTIIWSFHSTTVYRTWEWQYELSNPDRLSVTFWFSIVYKGYVHSGERRYSLDNELSAVDDLGVKRCICVILKSKRISIILLVKSGQGPMSLARTLVVASIIYSKLDVEVSRYPNWINYYLTKIDGSNLFFENLNGEKWYYYTLLQGEYINNAHELLINPPTSVSY